ncbi:MAG: NAD-dependent epimerase/dehydratase family protein [Rhizobacter sp.]
MAALPPLPPADLAHARAVVGGERWQKLQGQHLFLTGGTGFIGKWLLATLLDANTHHQLGCRVTVLTRNPQAFRTEVPHLADAAGVELIAGDVRHLNLGERHVDRIVHAATDVAAAASDSETFDTCVQGTRQVLELARRCQASLLLVSSGAVYGNQAPDIPALREDHPVPAEPVHAASGYTAGKRAAEWLAHAHAREHGLDLKIARCFAFVGPYLPLDKHFAIGNFLRDALAGQPITIQGNGTPLRSYLHAADMAAWLWAILLEGHPLGIYNVGGDEALSIRQLAERVVNATGSASVVHVLQPPAAGTPAARYVPDVSKVKAELALTEPIGLDDALRRTAAWHASTTRR